MKGIRQQMEEASSEGFGLVTRERLEEFLYNCDRQGQVFLDDDD